MMCDSSLLYEFNKQIQDHLKDNYTVYVKKLNAFLKNELSREKFELEVKKLFSPEKECLHNNFIRSFFIQIELPLLSNFEDDTRDSSAIAKHERSKAEKYEKAASDNSHMFQQQFQPAFLSSYIPRDAKYELKHDKKLVYCTDEAAIPSAESLLGRAYVAAWQCGVKNIQEDVPQILVSALKVYIKNILSAVLARRNSYKVRENRFKYAFGSPPVNVYLRNTPKSNLDFSNSYSSGTKLTTHIAESDAAVEISCDNVSFKERPPISAYDLLDALQVNRNIISSHTVYSLNIERILARLYHPSREELEKEHMFNQEAQLRENLDGNIYVPHTDKRI